MIRALILAASLSLVATSASALPVAGFIVGALGITSAIGVALVQIGVGLAVNYISSALARRAASKVKTPGIRTETATVGDTTPQTIMLGTYATAGNALAPSYSHTNDESFGLVGHARRTAG